MPLLLQPLHNRKENPLPIGRAKEFLRGPFWMGHHSHNAEIRRNNSCDVVRRTVGVPGFFHLTQGTTVPEEHLPSSLQLGKLVWREKEIPLVVGNGNADDLSRSKEKGEGGVCTLHPEENVPANEPPTPVGKECPGEESALKENLESVANAKDNTPRKCEIPHRPHNGRKPSDGSGSEIITITESPGEDHTVASPEVSIAVPEEHHFLPEHIPENVETVVVTV